MPEVHYILFGFAVLLILSIIASKVSGRLGIPSLLAFLGIGMLAGSKAIGGIDFNNPWLAQFLGIVALSYILFDGGIQSGWNRIKPAALAGLSLSVVGTLISTAILGLFVSYAFHLGMLESLLVGAIICPTDAAAVFSILRSSGISMRGSIAEAVEFESGSNDPMAAFLTISLIALIQHPDLSAASLIPDFFLEMSIGVLAGYALGRGTIAAINHWRLNSEGLYPVFTLAMVMLIYSTAVLFNGNGFLAVYIASLVIGNRTFFHKRSLMRFHAGVAWLMQILMFLTLGLLVSPFRLVEIGGMGISLSLILVFVARPLSVFGALLFSKFTARDKAMISWMGLKGAVPIVFATFPLLAGIEHSTLIFHIVFFAVLISVLVQGMTIAPLAKLLKVQAPLSRKKLHEEEHGILMSDDSEMNELIVPLKSKMVGHPVMKLHLPSSAMILMITREDGTLVPNGRTRLEAGDVLTVLANQSVLQSLTAKLTEAATKAPRRRAIR